MNGGGGWGGELLCPWHAKLQIKVLVVPEDHRSQINSDQVRHCNVTSKVANPKQLICSGHVHSSTKIRWSLFTPIKSALTVVPICTVT